MTPAVSRVVLGSERLLASGRLKQQRVGIVANPASVDAGFQHIVQRLGSDPDIRLRAIFGPQHGFSADVQDNMIETEHAVDSRTGLPTHCAFLSTAGKPDKMQSATLARTRFANPATEFCSCTTRGRLSNEAIIPPGKDM
jgi:uncharacterized protein YbbC (DUF1343 family)